MQKRSFGQTGLESTLLGFGGFHLLEIDQQTAGLLLNQYLDAGGNYIETAASYGDGESERKIGHAISHRRSEYMLVSKCGKRTKDEFLASLDRSLANLQTDHLDLIPDACRGYRGRIKHHSGSWRCHGRISGG